MLATRGHLREKTDPKTRVVMNMAFESVIIENMIGRKVIEYFKSRSDHPIFFGAKSMERLPRLTHPDNYNYKVTLDWSEFDSTIPRFLLEDAF